jgi:hypothetical protein
VNSKAKTHWKLRIAVLVIVAVGLLVFFTRAFWAEHLYASLVCEERIPHSEALMLDNFDTHFYVFEHAAMLQRDGIAEKVFVPLPDLDETEAPRVVSRTVLDVLARGAGLSNFEVIPIQIKEPISLNASKQMRDALVSRHIRSVVLVTPRTRSRRSLLIYKKVLTPAGIEVGCAPVSGQISGNNWTTTWHAMVDVILEFLKLQYYRFYVLR